MNSETIHNNGYFVLPVEKQISMTTQDPVCLQDKIGGCGGCTVLSIMEKYHPSGLLLPSNFVQKVQARYCPPNRQLRLPEKVIKTIW